MNEVQRRSNELKDELRKRFEEDDYDERLTYFYPRLAEKTKELWDLSDIDFNINKPKPTKSKNKRYLKLHEEMVKYYYKLKDKNFKPYQLIEDINLIMDDINEFTFMPDGEQKTEIWNRFLGSFCKCCLEFEFYKYFIGHKRLDEIKKEIFYQKYLNLIEKHSTEGI